MLRTAIVSTYAPRHCGIATFTTDLVRAVGRCEIVALQPPDQVEKNPPEVHRVIRRDVQSDHVQAAEWVNRCGAGVVSIQHDTGIWGGEDDSHVLDFVHALTLPVVTTLHTLLHTSDCGPAGRHAGTAAPDPLDRGHVARSCGDHHRRLWRGPGACPCHPPRRAGPALRGRRIRETGPRRGWPPGAAQLRIAEPEQGLRVDDRGDACRGQGGTHQPLRDPRRDPSRVRSWPRAMHIGRACWPWSSD